MSIVGTRPPLISETNLYEPHHKVRLAIKPGITGMWQVSGRSDITDFEEVVRLDKEYIEKYYEEEINGVKVLRIRVPEFSKTNKKSRVKNIVSYFFGAMGATFKVGKMDYVFSISQPPILGGLLGVWGKWLKHAKYIYNIQDFNPEQVLAVGYTKSKLITDAMALDLLCSLEPY